MFSIICKLLLIFGLCVPASNLLSYTYSCNSLFKILFILIAQNRPLWVEYPNDNSTYTMDDQFLLGTKSTYGV